MNPLEPVIVMVVIVLAVMIPVVMASLERSNIRSWRDFRWASEKENLLRRDADQVAAAINNYLAHHPIYPDREVKVRLHDVDINQIEFWLTIDLDMVSKQYRQKAEKDLSEILGRRVDWTYTIDVKTPADVAQRLTGHVVVGN